MDTYSWVTGTSAEICDGNCAFVTRNVEMRRLWRLSRSSLMRGYLEREE
jgi:hypothetical protein